MKLTLKEINDRRTWEDAGFTLPEFDIMKVRSATRVSPKWLHFGAGNIFRAFPAAMMQKLLNEGIEDTGLIVAECFDGDIIDKAYLPYDCLSVLSILCADGNVKNKVIASICEALRCDGCRAEDEKRLTEIFTQQSLRMVSMTITEKGYAVDNAKGEILPFIQKDIDGAPENAVSTMGRIAYGLYQRFLNGRYPLALVSMDNCSHNGDKLKKAILCIAEGWANGHRVPRAFIDYLNDPACITFPISMIDKITPRPDGKVAEMLKNAGFEDAAPIVTAKNTYTAAYVNAEETEYLVIEDSFPAGRVALERAGVCFVSREDVDKAEKMKVCTCLNPLHTALAVLGCLLGYRTICAEMGDPDLNKLVHLLAYREAMPVVVDPGFISPDRFADEVLEKRLPNPFMPDTPQRIATDTSQKISVRFGETLKAYAARADLDVVSLKIVPFVLAAWLRYLLGLDDQLESFEPSPDPLLEEMRGILSFVRIGEKVSADQLTEVWKHRDIFNADLTALGLTGTVTDYFNRMIAGKGAVRDTLRRVIGE